MHETYSEIIFFVPEGDYAVGVPSDRARALAEANDSGTLQRDDQIGGDSMKKTSGFVQLLRGMVAACIALLLTVGVLFSTFFHTMEDANVLRKAGEAARPMQMARITSLVERYANQYGFDEASVAALIDKETLEAYQEQVNTWWLDLLKQGMVNDYPAWDGSAIGETIMADDGYRAQVDRTELRTIAVDQVQAAICQEVKKTILPLRISLLTAGLQLVDSKVPLPKLVSLLHLIPGFCAGLAIALLVLMLICHRREGSQVRTLGGAAIWGGVWLSGLVVLLFCQMDPVGQAQVISPLFASQLTVLCQEMGRTLLFREVVLLLAGFLLSMKGKQ